MTKKIKLVHVISSLKLGGAEAILVDLLKQLGNNEYEHHVICFHGGPNLARIQALGVPTYHITGVVSLYDPVFWVRLFRCIKRIKPDLIHAHLWAANFAARLIGNLLRIPVINSVHAQLAHHGALRIAIDRYTFGWATKIVAVSSSVAVSLEKVSIKPGALLAVDNGIDIDAVQMQSKKECVARELFGWSDEHIIIGIVGRLEPVKNHTSLIKAFAKVHAQEPKVRLLIVGCGSLEEQLRLRVDELKLQEEIQFVIGKSAYGYYPMMDIFVLPSFSEGLSVALLEAIACGVPCITTGSKGLHEVITSGQSGLVLTEPTVNALEQALMSMLSDPSLRSLMARVAINQVRERFSLSKMADSYAQLYDILIHNKYKKTVA